MIISEQVGYIVRQTTGIRDATSQVRELANECNGQSDKIAGGDHRGGLNPIDTPPTNLLAASRDLERAVEDLHRELQRFKEPGPSAQVASQAYGTAR